MKIIPIAMFCVGLYFISLSTYNRYIAYDSRDWPTAKGVILSSDYSIEHVVETDDDGYTREYDVYWPNIYYEYSINSNKYTSNQITSGWSERITHEHEVKEIINKYEVGKEVNVYYAPHNHDFAILEFSELFKDYMALGMAVFFTGIMALFVFK